MLILKPVIFSDTLIIPQCGGFAPIYTLFKFVPLTRKILASVAVCDSLYCTALNVMIIIEGTIQRSDDVANTKKVDLLIQLFDRY